MLPVIQIGNAVLPMYWICALAGFVAAIMLFIRTGRKYSIARCDVFYASLYCIVGVLIGSKLIYALTILPKVISHFNICIRHPIDTLVQMFSGYVFYGGLLVGGFGIYIYCRKFHLELSCFADAVAPAIPLMHAFGRLGCFCAGCCYGREYHGLGAVRFPENEFTHEISRIPRFPTQLTELFFDLILCIVLYIYISKKPKSFSALGIYITAYALMRFALEFMRGDSARGLFLQLSTSQWISLLLLPLGIWLIIRRRRSF